MSGKRRKPIPSLKYRKVPTITGRSQPVNIKKGNIYSDTRWRKTRLWVLMREPLCRACKRNGTITAATQVDHIIPHRGCPKRFRDIRNLQPLCGPCHANKSAQGL